MKKYRNYWDSINCPGQFFETLGIVSTIVSAFVVLIGLLAAIFSSDRGYIILIVVISVIVPQLFFAISKVVKAAEKYLRE